MAKEGFTLIVGGEEVYSTDKKVLSVSITSEQGELARFGVADIHNLEFITREETGFNRHLNDVEREKAQARKERVEAEEESTDTTAADSVPDPVTEDETEESDADFSFGSTNDENEDM